MLRRAATAAPAALLLTAALAVASPGALDPTFGSSGTVITNVNPGASMFIYSIAIDGQGRIVATGRKNNSIVVARYSPNGTLDSTFGTGGIVTTSFAGSVGDIGYAVAIDSSGRIVVGGTSDNGSMTRIAVLRYLSSGQLDTSFNTTGEALTTIGTQVEVFHSVAMTIDGSGNIVVATNAYNGSINSDFGVIRFTPNGQLDTSFGGTGKVITALGSNFHDFDSVGAVAIDGSHILVAGEYENDSDTGNNLTVIRYNSSGTLDSTFGGGGVVSIAAPLNVNFNAIVLDAQQRIYAAGAGVLARFTHTGTLDPSFGSGGTVTTTAPPYPWGLAIDSSGHIIEAGETVLGGSTDQVSVARYLTSGAVDTSFGSGGSVTTDIGPSHYAYARSVALDPQGRIVIGGGSYDQHTGLDSLALARYLGDAAQPAAESLTVTKSGGGLGTVTSSPAGIDCGATCSAGFAQGTQVTLNASPVAPSTFAGWSGACSGTGTCTVTLSSSQSVTATFLRGNPLLLGAVKANKHRGTARIAATVPGSGTLVIAGNGVKRQTIHATRASTVSLTIQLTKKLAGKLRRTGKVTVTVSITYTPASGSPMTLTRRVTLVRPH